MTVNKQLFPIRSFCRGVSMTQARLCRDAGLSYTEDDEAQDAMARQIATELFGDAGTEALHHASGAVSASELACAVNRVFSESPVASCSTAYPCFVLENFFLEERRRITAMGMTGDASVCVIRSNARKKPYVRAISRMKTA